MAALHIYLAPSDDFAIVLLRTSASPNPEQKPPMRIAREDLASVLLVLLDTANARQGVEMPA